jgi:transposase InsO family protein
MVQPRYRLRVKQHLAIVKYVQQHNVSAAARRFGLTRGTVRLWRDRWRAEGLKGLIPRYPDRRRRRRVTPEIIELIRQARAELAYGSGKTKIWLERVHRVRLTTVTIQRVFRDLGMPRLRRTKRRPARQLLLFEKDKPGDSVQVDVKVVKTAEGRSYQYTAIDDCTRYRVLRLYRRCNEATSLNFLHELRRGLPFPIRKLQTDNGSEFSITFALSVQEAGIKHRYIRPRRPQQNGKVERSHRIDTEEFWGRQEFPSHDDAAVALDGWQHTYNHQRFSMALNGRTPAEKLTSLLGADYATSEHVPLTLGGGTRAAAIAAGEAVGS